MTGAGKACGNKPMGKTHRRGKERESHRRPIQVAEALELEDDKVFDFQRAYKGGREKSAHQDSSRGKATPFFIDKIPNPRVAGGGTLGTSSVLGNVLASGEDTVYKDSSSSPSRQSDSELPDSDSDDEEFANLVRECKALMCGDDEKIDLGWSLDETAARLLRDRKASDPKYARMSSEEFDQVICFEEIYGKKQQRANLASRLQRTKERGTAPSTSSSYQVETEERVNFRQLNRDIKEFVRHEDVGEQMELDPHPSPIRRFIHELAHMYGLSSKSEGAGVERHCVLVKGERTRLPRDLRRLDKFLERAQKASQYIYRSESVKGKKDPTAGTEKSNRKGRPVARVAPGAVIGAEAAPIEEGNIGNRMLRKLGWSPGQGLGSAKSGRTDPVEVVYKGNRSGLGH